MTTETVTVEAKAFYKTRRFWGAVIALLGFFAPAQALMQKLGVTEDTMMVVVDQVLLIGGSVMGVWGSIKAENPVGIKDGEKAPEEE